MEDNHKEYFLSRIAVAYVHLTILGQNVRTKNLATKKQMAYLVSKEFLKGIN